MQAMRSIPMNLEQYAVYDERYRELRTNGWPKLAAADAARRHLRHLKPRQFKAAVAEALKAQASREKQ